MSDAEQPKRELLEGHPGDSLFSRPILDLPRFANELPELFKKVEGMHDDRLLAIVTALIVENRLDRILAFFLPRYSVFEKVTDFGFSMKIRLLQALNLIPPLIPAAANSIREIRNEFAHQLSKTQFSEIDPKILGRLRGIERSVYAKFEPSDQPEKSLKEIFHQVTFFCVVGLDRYAANVRVLREYISQPGFVDTLAAEVQFKSMTWIEEVTSGTPIGVERQGDLIIEHFAGGVSHVRDARPDDPPPPPPSSA